MNSKISLFSLMISCRLCLSAVLFTLDAEDGNHLEDILLSRGDHFQAFMESLSEIEKGLICKEIVESSKFSDIYDLEFVDKRHAATLRRYSKDFPKYLEDVYRHAPDLLNESYVISHQMINYDRCSVSLKTFGCLTHKKSDNSPFVIFISSGRVRYTFIISVPRASTNSDEGVELDYVGIAEFYVSSYEVRCPSPSLSVLRRTLLPRGRYPWHMSVEEQYEKEYSTPGYIGFVTNLLELLPTFRGIRVCKIVYSTRHSPNVDPEVLDSASYSYGELELSNGSQYTIPILFCSSNNVDKLYLTPSKQFEGAAYILKLKDSNEQPHFELDPEVGLIPSIPALSLAYLQY